MNSSDHREILYFEDPIGVTAGYRRLFDRLSRGLATPVSMYRVFRKEEILIYRGNRKAPGYNPDDRIIRELTDKFMELMARYTPRVIVLTDPSMLFLCVLDREADWSWATIDNLRGGVYQRLGYTLVVTYPLTAWHQDVRERDIAAANYGFTSKDEFDEAQGSTSSEDLEDDDSSESETTSDTEGDEGEATTFYEPIQTKVAVGKFCLESDWAKIHRILAEQSR